jgi:hypothetical protein
MPFGAWKGQGPSFFYFGYFFSSKNINDFAKDVNIFHFKSSNSPKPNYFPTATTLGHTSHHHNQFIAHNQFLTWRNTTNLL